MTPNDPLLISIGIDPTTDAQLRTRLKNTRVVHYAAPPPAYSLDGQVRIESQRVPGRWLEPNGVIYYGYFPHAQQTRRALALANTPTFPNIRPTLPHDDRVLSLLLANPNSHVPRGFLPQGHRLELPTPAPHVFKWSNSHCGEDKALSQGPFTAPDDTLVEPYIPGTSDRILIIGPHTWHLRYHSHDWRKNVEAAIETLPLEPTTPKGHTLLSHASLTAHKLNLDVVGIDYQVPKEGPPTLLEVNTYPGFDQVEGAEDAFINQATQWWEDVQEALRRDQEEQERAK